MEKVKSSMEAEDIMGCIGLRLNVLQGLKHTVVPQFLRFRVFRVMLHSMAFVTPKQPTQSPKPKKLKA